MCACIFYGLFVASEGVGRERRKDSTERGSHTIKFRVYTAPVLVEACGRVAVAERYPWLRRDSARKAND